MSPGPAQTVPFSAQRVGSGSSGGYSIALLSHKYQLGILCRRVPWPSVGCTVLRLQTMTNEILNIREVAELLRVAETVYSMAQRGELPAFKVRG